jgi:hypothetical protein
MMKTYKVTLIIKNSDKSLIKTEMPAELFGQLADSLAENGEEQVHTTQGSYKVIGVIIGGLKDKVLIL